MRFSLTLNGWPPLASHLACLLLGFSLANLSWPDAEPGLHLPAHSITLSFAPGLLKLPSGAALKRGMKVHALQRVDGYVCRITRAPWLVIEREPTPAISAAFTAAPELGTLSRASATQPLELHDADRVRLLPACADRPRVSYGPG